MSHSESAPGLDSVRVWRHGHAAYVQLNRPQKANAYTQAMLETLGAHVEQLGQDAEARVVVICGAGDRAFCAGADREELAGRNWRSALNLKSAQVFELIGCCPKVTLAAINGAAVGGGLELALACDIRIAEPHARFSCPEPMLGLIPAAGGTGRLPQVVGTARAKELILAGCVWEAEQALRFGLLSEVTQPGELLARAQQWAERIADRSSLALELAKLAIDHPPAGQRNHGLERLAQALLYELRSKGEKL